MDDFPGLLAKDFVIKPQGKSAAMAPPRANLSSVSNFGLRSDFGHSSSANAESSAPIFDDYDRDGLLFDDVFGGPPKYSSEFRAAASSSFDYDSIFKDHNAKSSSMPVFGKPVYDDDIFDGLPGLKTSSTSSAPKYDNIFASISGSPPTAKNKMQNSSPFDDLLGNLGRKGDEMKTERMRPDEDASAFDDLIPGFGGSSPPLSSKSTSESGRSQKPSSNSIKTSSNLMEDPFFVLESASTPADSSSGLFTDPMEEINKLNGSMNTRMESSSVSGGVFDGLEKSGRSEINKRGKDRSMNGQAPTSEELCDKEDYEVNAKGKTSSIDNFPESHQTMFGMPNVSTDFPKSVSQTTTSYMNASSNETSSQVNATPGSESNFDSLDDTWLAVSEIPLITHPTSAPPPSRPPPPRPPRVSKSDAGSFSSSNAKKVNDFSSFPNSTQFSHNSQSCTASRSSVTSRMDELEDFAMGGTQNSVSEQPEVFPGEDFVSNSVAAASAAAMKEAMDRAEAKFRHAREMRERENLKAARSREAGLLDKEEKVMQDAQDRELGAKQEKMEQDKQQRERDEEETEQRRREIEREREEKEREQRRLEKERERAREVEREREKARQAVERATREARERAAAEARHRAERAVVEKAAAEARERAERAAVQRAQAEARERAAAEARERAERAAAEARERANAEARERAALSEARVRAERAAVEARERAAAATRANQQKNDNDLDSFFSMGRASSAPRPRANSSDPLFDMQNKAAPEAARGTSVGSSSSIRKASSAANIVDDLTSIFGAAVSSAGEFQEIEGESEERRRARLERHQRTQERAAKALAEKNERDLQAQREQAERHRIAETLDFEIRRWAAGKEGNLRALLSTLQYVLWPECGWQPVSLTDLITAAAVKKVYRKATLCIHPDKVQQKGANLQQKYIAEKVFDLLKEAWNKFNSEELF
ncbi:hypothetical protein SLA2020_467840 [Shorea laevis]